MPKINDDNLYQKSNELDRKEEILNRKYLYLKETTGILYQEHLNLKKEGDFSKSLKRIFKSKTDQDKKIKNYNVLKNKFLEQEQEFLTETSDFLEKGEELNREINQFLVKENQYLSKSVIPSWKEVNENAKDKNEELKKIKEYYEKQIAFENQKEKQLEKTESEYEVLY